MLKKASFYTYTDGNISLGELEDKLENFASRELGKLDLEHFGWGVLRDETRYISSEDIIYLVVEKKTKIIPRCTVIKEYDDAIAKFEMVNGYEPDKAQKAEIKNNVMDKLCEVALCRVKRTPVLISQSNNNIIIGSASKPECDDIMKLIHSTFNVVLTYLKDDFMQHWLTNMVCHSGDGSVCVMDSGVLTCGKKKISISNDDMESDSVKLNIDNGYIVKELALSTETVRFKLTDDFVLKNIRYDFEFSESFEGDLILVRDALCGTVETIKKSIKEFMA